MRNPQNRMACPAGIEPATPSLEGWCSIQLSYGQMISTDSRGELVGVEGFEPPTSCSQSKRATGLRYTPRNEYFAATSLSRQLRLKTGRTNPGSTQPLPYSDIFNEGRQIAEKSCFL